MTTKLKPSQFIVDKRGRPRAVVLSLVNYRKLVHLIEDLSDSKTLRQAIRSSHGTFSHHDLLTHLKHKRLL